MLLQTLWSASGDACLRFIPIQRLRLGPGPWCKSETVLGCPPRANDRTYRLSPRFAARFGPPTVRSAITAPRWPMGASGPVVVS